MTNPIIKIINVQTGEEIERAMTKAETDEFNKANIQPQEVLDRKAEAASKATAKAELWLSWALLPKKRLYYFPNV
jgi:hypothetical protein